MSGSVRNPEKAVVQVQEPCSRCKGAPGNRCCVECTGSGSYIYYVSLRDLAVALQKFLLTH